ncbi:MAG: hypothetical protein RLZZ584_2701 [Pseudomonadota bacterium]
MTRSPITEMRTDWIWPTRSTESEKVRSSEYSCDDERDEFSTRSTALARLLYVSVSSEGTSPGLSGAAIVRSDTPVRLRVLTIRSLRMLCLLRLVFASFGQKSRVHIRKSAEHAGTHGAGVAGPAQAAAPSALNMALMPRTAWRMRLSFSIRAKRTWSSPWSPKPMPGLTHTLALSSSWRANSSEPSAA